MNEEVADEKAYCSIFVERFYYLLFHVVGAEPGANWPRPLGLNLDHGAAVNASVVSRGAGWCAAAGRAWPANASGAAPGGSGCFPRHNSVPATEKPTGFH